jgi:hypothetical protein
MYPTIIRPIVLYGFEVCTQSINDENTVAIWERKILRRIFGPIK